MWKLQKYTWRFWLLSFGFLLSYDAEFDFGMYVGSACWNKRSSGEIIINEKMFNYVRGHSKNTWHFFGSFHPTPPFETCFCFWSLIFKLNLPKTVKWTMKNYLQEPNLAGPQNFSLPKALKKCFQVLIKSVWQTQCWPPPSPKMSPIIWTAPY
jgi:hypothetical protein